MKTMEENCKKLFNEELLENSIWGIIAKDYEFAIVIEVATQTCKVINKHKKNEIPNLLDGDEHSYNEQLNSFLNNSIIPYLKDEAKEKMSFQTIVKRTLNGKQYTVIFPVKYSDGRILYKKWRYYKLPENNDYIIFTRVDVTDSVISESNVVTGVPAREKAIFEIKKIIEKNKHEKFYMMWVDFDEFSDYNELFGKINGDELLKYFSKKLLSLKIKNSQLGQIEADNFLYFLPVESFKKEDYESIYKDVSNYNQHFSFSISIGMSIVNGDSTDLHTALEKARQANLKLKASLGISFKIYDEVYDKEMFTNQTIVPYLKDGIRNKEFIIHYQPIINTKTNKVVTAEALVRWSSAKFGYIRPDHFIPILEKNGFIVDLDYYVREKVLDFIETRIKNKDPIVPISVNLSRLEVNDLDFPLKLKQQIEKRNVPINMLRLELTESVVMDHPEITNIVISKLKKYGFYIEMDDFGSAYSSLAVLRDLPFDLIKLDMKFFKDGDVNKKTDAIIEAISNLAQGLDIEVIAEGVEKENQIKALKKKKITLIQGFYFSKPLSQDDFVSFATKMNGD